MLIGIPPLLGPGFLSILREMGHGDELAIVDGNYPAEDHGRRVLRADGHGVIEVMEAVLSVLPVDDFVQHALFCASVEGDPARLDPVHHEMIALCAHRVPGMPVLPLAGAAFYERVKAAYAVVATSEPRLYGNFIVRKGVIRPGSIQK